MRFATGKATDPADDCGLRIEKTDGNVLIR
jgi:hypothetical protein